MILPFDSLLTEQRELGLVVAVGIGFFFGFALERAGFGRASKLAAQFYLHDMTVFKVMFTAIVTAMLGVVIADGFGLIDLRAVSESAASQTYIWPMLVGGVLLGVGFIVSGYCPGTSAVATASGNLDGLVAFAGVIVGSVVYSEIHPYVEGFYDSGAAGHVFLYDLLGLPPAVVAAMVVAMAVGCFFVVDRVERIFEKKRTGQEPEPAQLRPRRITMAVLGAATVLALVTLLLPSFKPHDGHKAPGFITPARLAERILDEPWKLRVLDVRAQAECEAARVPGSECAPLETLGDLGLAYSPGVRDLVLVAEKDIRVIPPAAAKYRGEVLILVGGFEAWRAFALTPPGSPEADEYDLRVALHRTLTGTRQAPPPRKAVKYTPPKRKKGGGCD